MTRSESKARREEAVAMFVNGSPIEECAEATGYTADYVRQILTKRGLWTPKWTVATEREAQAVKMLRLGRSPDDIAEELGYRSNTSIYSIAKKNGVSSHLWKEKQTTERAEAMRKFKAEGHTHRETAEKFGVSVALSHAECKGIAPQRVDGASIAKEQNLKTLNEREAKAANAVTEAGFEYVGGFVNTNGYVTIRCPKCGEVFERSMVSIRHRGEKITCTKCIEIAKEQKRKEEEKRKREREEERIRKVEEREQRAQEKENAKMHKCPVCGEMTTRPKYCSLKCSRKVANTLHEVKRRKKIDHVKVDSDISLKKLYERDHGVCYLCGEVCDWEDKEEKGGVVVCGNRYPSIDHVVPLARGGEHSWENVKLAHRICNTRKGAKHQKIASLLTTKE